VKEKFCFGLLFFLISIFTLSMREPQEEGKIQPNGEKKPEARRGAAGGLGTDETDR
jgi:hypothetical protein